MAEMPEKPFSDAELEAYLEESLAPDMLARIEAVLREQPRESERLATIIGRRDAGVHSLGEIWRRNRSSCPSRETLGSFLLGVLDDEHADYITFHLETIGCRYCQANLEDLQRRHEESNEVTETRCHRYFQSSAGYLRSK
jgi:hypothetical protein